MKTCHWDPRTSWWKPKGLAKYLCYNRSALTAWCSFRLGWDLICVRWNTFHHQQQKVESSILWENKLQRFCVIFLRHLSLFWHGRKVLHASQHPLLWQLHLMSAKWSEKHPSPWVASWWQGRGDAVIRALKSCTHLGRWNAHMSGLYQVAPSMALKPNKTFRPTSHGTLPQTAGQGLGWPPQAVL